MSEHTPKPIIALSVRELVEFTIHGEDLAPSSGSLTRMLEGGRAHRARQKSATEAAYQSEVPLSLSVEGELLCLQIGGRADALFDREGTLVVEEIKLAPFSEGPLTGPLPEHLAQALCYGHMLCEDRRELPGVLLRVLYVSSRGREVAVFEEYQDFAQLREGFEALLTPMLAYQEKRHRHLKRRDEALGGLAFPYDTYREGQRTFSSQTYWAIHLQRRLLAQAPTGTGKTLATLFPALKALGEGKTGQVFYLTARTTGRGLALSTLELLMDRGAWCYALELTAKEKICPQAEMRCFPEDCPRAKGFFLRLPDAIEAMEEHTLWTRALVEQIADQFDICPFEFSLALSEIADVVICDYNYAFDPVARLRRIFLFRQDVTLLIDEAHHLVERAREMFSGELDGAWVRELRRLYGKARGRKNAVYKGLTGLLRFFDSLREELREEKERTDREPPEGLFEMVQIAIEAMTEVEPLPEPMWTEVFFALLTLQSILQEFDDTYVVFLRRAGKEVWIRLFCLDPAPRLQSLTKRTRGCVFFSATLSPLPGYARMLGLEEEDGKLSLPSPFPPERLLVLKRRVNTRYHHREQSARQVADALLALLSAHPGNYLMMFPSYAYLRRVREEIEAQTPAIRLLVQESGMDEAAREAFLAEFVPTEETLLGLVVMGGVFSEGVDLPGDRLCGVIVVGIGLPQICQEREALRAYFDRVLGDGFAYAYRIPGLTKVVQAAGRVIRTPQDRGAVLLLDDRFFGGEVLPLLPIHWRQQEGRDIARQARTFWEACRQT